uniref:Uncharacterized protein n=1 Tax=Arundo donax TaxID=35708 RepID=A0A0A9B9U0_ARUDO
MRSMTPRRSCSSSRNSRRRSYPPRFSPCRSQGPRTATPPWPSGCPSCTRWPTATRCGSSSEHGRRRRGRARLPTKASHS